VIPSRGIEGDLIIAMKKESALPVIDGNAVASSRLTRRELVQRMLAGAAWPVVSAAHPFYALLENGTAFDLQDPLPTFDWKPVFLKQSENRRLVVVAERIVPGSEKAQVNRFIDLLLSVDNEKHQRDFVDALSAFELESGRRFGKRLTALDGAQVDEILTDAAANKAGGRATSSEREENGLHAHFENLKGWISGAYYSSEAGMRELGWNGDYVFVSFPGCEHPEGHS
jgi:Gluconate 2-dehydrogenase subunit 3